MFGGNSGNGMWSTTGSSLPPGIPNGLYQPAPSVTSNNSFSSNHFISSQHSRPGPTLSSSTMFPPSSSGQMLPPASSRLLGNSGQPKNRHTLLQEERKRAALQRQQEREQAKKAAQDLMATSGLFQEPVRISDDAGGQVAQVLGTFSDAHNVINSKTSCIGIEYQPPTPAPSLHHHIIGEEDDDRSHPPHSSSQSMSRTSDLGATNRHSYLSQQHDSSSQHRRGPVSMPRPMPSQRLPENLMQPHRPVDKNRNQNSHLHSRQMPPPAGVQHQSAYSSSSSGALPHRTNSPNVPYSSSSSLQGYYPSGNGPMHVAPDVTLPSNTTSTNRMKHAAKNLPKLSVEKNQIEAMVSEMKLLNTPITGIVTPRIDLGGHMGNSARFSEPKYFSALPPMMTPLKSPPQSLKEFSPFVKPLDLPKAPLLKPSLSEDSDSDDGGASSSSKSAKNTRDVHPVEKSSVPNTLPKPEIETEPQKQSNQSSSGDSSSDDSSSDDSSSDEEDNNKKPEKKFDASLSPNLKNPSDVDEDDDDDDLGNNIFSLTNLIGRVRSTHSPSGPSSNMSQHVQSPRNLENFPSTLDSLGLPPESPSDGIDSKDEDAPISHLLSHTPQPLPDLIDDIGMPISPIPQSPAEPTPKVTTSLTPDHHTETTAKRLPTSDEETFTESGGRRRKKRTPKSSTRSPVKSHRKRSIRLSEDSNSESEKQKKEAQTRSNTTPRALPRASATPLTKSKSNSDDDIIDPVLVDVDKKPRKRRTKKSSAANKRTPVSAVSPRARSGVNVCVSSSSDDDYDDEAHTKESTSVASKRSSVTKRKSRSGKIKSDKSDNTEEDGSDKEENNLKTAAIQMIFPASRTKSTGKSGIKVEVHHAPPPAATQSDVILSPPTVAIKSQGLSNAATLISQASPAPYSELPKQPEMVQRRTDGRPIIICKIPLNLLGHSLRNVVSQKKQKENTPANHYSSGRERQHSVCSNVSSTSSRVSFKRRRRRDESIGSDASENLQPNAKRKKNEYDNSATGDSPRSSGLDSSNLMPPPNRVFYSYMEHKRPEEEEFDEGDNGKFMTIAKRLKHEADSETVREKQAIKYLQAVLYFTLCGNYTEVKGDKQTAFNMYKETLDLVRHVSKNPTSATGVDNKLAVLSHRCQSLLYLRLYKLRKQDLSQCQKILEDHLMKASKRTEQHSPGGLGQPAISPTPSPAGSEGSVCSKSSGYTSANELANSATPTLTVPQNIMQKQYQYCNYLSQCHELWEIADLCAHRGHCEDFIIRLDRLFGPLTLHSSIKDLVRYTQTGLEWLSEEKEPTR